MVRRDAQQASGGAGHPDAGPRCGLRGGAVRLPRLRPGHGPHDPHRRIPGHRGGEQAGGGIVPGLVPDEHRPAAAGGRLRRHRGRHRGHGAGGGLYGGGSPAPPLPDACRRLSRRQRQNPQAAGLHRRADYAEHLHGLHLHAGGHLAGAGTAAPRAAPDRQRGGPALRHLFRGHEPLQPAVLHDDGADHLRAAHGLRRPGTARPGAYGPGHRLLPARDGADRLPHGPWPLGAGGSHLQAALSPL